MGLYDNILAQERERVAMAAIDVPAAQATQYGAARGMERMKQGVESMLGIENPAITAHKKQAARQELLNSILTQFPNMETRADYIGAINKLYASGFIEEANKVASMLKDIPKDAEPTTYQDNLGATRYLNSGTTWKAGDLVPGETAEEPSKTTDRTYNTTLALALANLQNNPKYLKALKTGDQDTVDAMIKDVSEKYGKVETYTQNGVVYNQRTNEPMLEGSTPTIKTFVQGGVVYDLATMQPVLEGSEEDRPTFVQDGITYYKDTQLPVLAGSEKKREKLLQGGIWRYVDNQAKVFPDVTLDKDVNQKAADLYNTWYAVAGNDARFNTNEGKVELATRLIQNNLANSKIFSDLVSSMDKDSANAIAQENLVVKGVERLSENYVDSGIGTMDLTLRPLELLINEYMPHLRTKGGDLIYNKAGDALRDTSQGIPGWGFFNAYQKYIGKSETVKQAQDFATKAQLLINTIIKERSGSAVSQQEADRLEKEYKAGFHNSIGFANWVSSVRRLIEQHRMEVTSGFMPEVQYRYFSQMGIYPTLHDPDEQLKSLPIGAKWRDESGALHQKQK